MEEPRHWGKQPIIGGKTRKGDRGAHIEPEGLKEEGIYQNRNIVEARGKGQRRTRRQGREQRTSTGGYAAIVIEEEPWGGVDAPLPLKVTMQYWLYSVERERGPDQRGADFNVVADCPLYCGSSSKGNGGDC